ncbi:PAS domain S-box protein [Leptospira ryugenii]|uniref:histidine kinase n=1 Tax=Leptospira ryugenii TaxID=1917863 RepID=A0A2P2DZ84_9LEPT|nr:PAS domain-containing sensor histidine kinase [Leptospira ryugenii]GBF49906.1 PAS domain S-box protein [Leptospira ryugenii]
MLRYLQKKKIYLLGGNEGLISSIKSLLDLRVWSFWEEREKTLDHIHSEDLGIILLLDPIAIDTINLLKQNHPNNPLILISQNDQPVDSISLYHAGLTDIVMQSNLNRLPLILDRTWEIYETLKQQSKTWDMLVHSEEIITRSQKLAKIGHFELDIPDGRMFWSLEMFNILDYSYALTPEISKIFDLVVGEERNELLEIWEKLNLRAMTYEKQIQVQTTKTNKYIHIVIESEFLGDQRIKIFGTLHDISQYNQLEEARQLNEQLFTGLFNNSSQMIILLDEMGKVQKMNLQSQKVFKIDENKTIGLDFVQSIFHSSAEKDKLVSSILETWKKGKTKLFLTYPQVGEKTLFLDCDLSIVKDSRGKGLYLVFEAKDITEKIDLERLYGQAQKMEALGTFASSIAHDFNNLLTPLLNYSQILNTTLKEDLQQQTMQKLIKSLDQAKSLVSQILDFGRKDSKDLIALDLNQSIVSFLAEQPSASQVKIIYSHEADIHEAWVLSNSTYTFQILSNLYENAIFAVKEREEPLLKISLRKILTKNLELIPYPLLPGEMYYELCFEDNGIGIPKENLNKIFEPFFSTKGKDGTGLGLPIVYGILRNLNGYIHVESELNLGTAIYCYFPVLK